MPSTSSVLRLRNLGYLVRVLALFGALCLLSACATMDDEGDMPWAQREPWEGVPGIPGMNRY